MDKERQEKQLKQIAKPHQQFFNILIDTYHAKRTKSHRHTKKDELVACVLEDWLNDININESGMDYDIIVANFGTNGIHYRDFLNKSITKNHQIVKQIKQYYDDVKDGRLPDDYDLLKTPIDEISDISSDIYYNLLVPLI